MKKNIIMIVIILICSMSLLYVMYIIKVKDIYYVSENNNSNIELTMKLGTTEITSFSDLDSSKYYRIDIANTSCDNTNTKLYWSNSTQKLKVSGVTTGLKCSIAFEEITEDINIVALTQTVNGVTSDITSVPTSGWYNITYSCKKLDGTASSATVSWDNEAHKLTTANIDSQTYCTVDFTSTSVVDFDYTGGEQTITLPNTGYYKLEVWGAKGGGGTYGEQLSVGNGGYSVGIYNNTELNKLLYINVGGAGKNFNGGYNGGGYGYQAPGGGGATHIALNSGQLSIFINNLDSLLIVAGGGGASDYWETLTGGNSSGGGYIGNTGGYLTNHPGYYGTGGTQTEGGVAYEYPDYIYKIAFGTFGQGGEFPKSIFQFEACGSSACSNAIPQFGGGGGYYGGGTSSRAHSGAGGGSGYIGNSSLISYGGVTKHMACYNCATSTDASTYTISNSNTSSTATSDFSKRGNGYARITYLGS